MGPEAPEFDWDDANRDHLALHNVTPEEAEQAILDPHAVVLDIQSDDEEERTKAVGITSSGRILAVVFTFRGEAIRPVTAYAAEARLQKIYLMRRGCMIRKPLPKFKSEKEEAQWWDEHRDETADWVEEAVARGETTTLSEVLDRRRQRAGSTPTVSIRIDPEDIKRARSLAAKKRLRYQTYLKMLLHEALEHEARRAN